MAELLLDTCTLVWLGNNEPLDARARRQIAVAAEGAGGVFVSPISAWEIGMLVSKNRLAMAATPDAFFDAALALPGVSSVPLTPAPLIGSSFLPGIPPRDPTDRILIATAREHDLRIVTRDRTILAYGAAGHVKTLAC